VSGHRYGPHGQQEGKTLILITGGGTGGHLRIAQLVKEELNLRGMSPCYIGSTYGQDQKWFADDSGWSDTLFLQSAGVVNKGLVGKIIQLGKILFFTLTLRKHFKQHGIRAVFSVGGYSAAPAVFAAILFRIPLFIHEQNAKSGLLNRLTKPFAKGFFSSFDPESPCPDYPVGKVFFESRRLRTEVKTVLFMGGSLGAKAINDLAMHSAKRLLFEGKTIIHLCGERDYERVSSFYRDQSLNVTCMAFCSDMGALLSQADFAVARSGASSLFEIYANALPTLFIPYPHAASDHQFYNAQSLVERGMAYCVRENELSDERFLQLLDEDHRNMSQKLLETFSPSGTSCIVEKILRA